MIFPNFPFGSICDRFLEGITFCEKVLSFLDGHFSFPRCVFPVQLTRSLTAPPAHARGNHLLTLVPPCLHQIFHVTLLWKLRGVYPLPNATFTGSKALVYEGLGKTWHWRGVKRPLDAVWNSDPAGLF